MTIDKFTLTSTLERFRDFADKPEMTRGVFASRLNAISAHDAGQDVVVRTLSKHERNNDLRKLFFKEIQSLYPQGIPANVLDVMKLKDFGGVVRNQQTGGVSIAEGDGASFNTGKKLSHRRVNTVLAAVEKDLATKCAKTAIGTINDTLKTGNQQAVLGCLKEVVNTLYGDRWGQSEEALLAELNDIAAEFVAAGRDLRDYKAGLRPREVVQDQTQPGTQRFCAALARFTRMIAGLAVDGEDDVQRKLRARVVWRFQAFVMRNADSRCLDMLYMAAREEHGDDGVRKFLEHHFNSAFRWGAHKDADGARLLHSRMRKIDDVLLRGLVRGDGETRAKAALKLKRVYGGLAGEYIADKADRNRMIANFHAFVDKAFPSGEALELDAGQKARLHDLAVFSYGRSEIDGDRAVEVADEGFVCNTNGFTLKLSEAQYEELSVEEKARFREATANMKSFLLELSRKCDAATRDKIRKAFADDGNRLGLISCKTAFSVYKLIKAQIPNAQSDPILSRPLEAVPVSRVAHPSVMRFVVGQIAKGIINEQESRFRDTRLTFAEKEKFESYLDCFVEELQKSGSATPTDDKLVKKLTDKVAQLYCLSKAEKMGSDRADFWSSPVFLPLIDATSMDRAASIPVGALLQMAGKDGDTAKLAARLLAYGDSKVAIAFLMGTKDEDLAELAGGDKPLSRELVFKTVCPESEMPADIGRMSVFDFLTERPAGVVYNAYTDAVLSNESTDQVVNNRKFVLCGYGSGLVLSPDLADDIANGRPAEILFKDVKAAFGVSMSESFKKYPAFNDLLADLKRVDDLRSSGISTWKNNLKGELSTLFDDFYRYRPTIRLFGVPDESKEHSFARTEHETEEDIFPKFVKFCETIDKMKWSDGTAVASRQKIGMLMLMGQAGMSPLSGLYDNADLSDTKTFELVDTGDKTASVIVSNPESKERHYELEYAVNSSGRNKVENLRFVQKKRLENPPLTYADLGSDIYGRDAQNRPSGTYRLKHYDNTGKYHDDIRDRYDAQGEDPTWADVLAGKVNGLIVSVRNGEEDLTGERDIHEVIKEAAETLGQPNAAFRKGILECLMTYAKESAAFIIAPGVTVPQKEAFVAFVTAVESALRLEASQSECAYFVRSTLQKYAEQMPPAVTDDLKAWLDKVEEALKNAGDSVVRIEDVNVAETNTDYVPIEMFEDEVEKEIVLADYDTQIRAALANRENALKALLGVEFNDEIRERCHDWVMIHLPGELKAALENKELEGTPAEKIEKVFEDNADILDVLYRPDVVKNEYYNFTGSASVHTVELIQQLMIVRCPASLRGHLKIFGFDNDADFGKLLFAAAARLLATQGDKLGTLEQIKKDEDGLIGSALGRLDDQLMALAKACGYVEENNIAGDNDTGKGGVNEFSKQILTTPLGRKCVLEFFSDEKPFEADKPFHETENAEVYKDDGYKYQELKKLYDEDATNRLVNDVQNRFEAMRTERRMAIAGSDFANSPAVKELNDLLNELRRGGLQEALNVPQEDVDRLTEKIDAYLKSRQSVAERGLIGYDDDLQVAERETDSSVAELKAEYQQLLKKYAKNGLDVNVNKIKEQVLRNLPEAMRRMAGTDRLLVTASVYVAEAAFNAWIAERKAAWGEDEAFDLAAESGKALEYVSGKLDERMANDVKRLITVSAGAMADMGMRPLGDVFADLQKPAGDAPVADMVRSLVKALADRIGAADALDDVSAKAIFDRCYDDCFVPPNRSAAENFIADEEGVRKLVQDLVSANERASTMDPSARAELEGKLFNAVSAHIRAYIVQPNGKPFAEFLEGLKGAPELKPIFEMTFEVRHRLAFASGILAHEDTAMSNAARLEFLNSDTWKNFVVSTLGLDGKSLEVQLGKLRDLSADFEPKNVLEAYRQAAQTDWASLDIAESVALMPTVHNIAGQLTDCYLGLKDICGAYIPENWFSDEVVDGKNTGLKTILVNATVRHLKGVIEEARKDAVANNKPFVYKESFTKCIVDMTSRVGVFGERVTAIANDIREALVAANWPKRESWSEEKDLSPALLNEFMSGLRSWMQALVQGSEDPIATNSTNEAFTIGGGGQRRGAFNGIVMNDPNKPKTSVFGDITAGIGNMFGGWFGKKK